jgi:rhamnose transport system permease protein
MRAAGSQSTDRQWALAAALVCEVAIFALVAPQFFTIANLFELTRFSAELGLLAVALTPVLVTGGIDLSVGSLLGLSAVMFGVACRDWQIAVPFAALVALLVGCAGGALNAFLIAGLGLPPLIVTLASFSLFRGIAEGLTGAAINYTAFPTAFSSSGRAIWPASCRRSCRSSPRS